MALRHFRLRRRSSCEEAKTHPSLSIKDPVPVHLGRSASALAYYRPHQLSEIAEISGSSHTSLSRRHTTHRMENVDGLVEMEDTTRVTAKQDRKNRATSVELTKIVESHSLQPGTPRSDLRSLAPSAFSLPLQDIPQRRSSMTALSQNFLGSQRASLQDLRSNSTDVSKYLTTRGCVESPVRHLLDRGPQSSEAARASPPQTFIRTTTPFYLLDGSDTRNPRLEMAVRLPSPLFVGGGTVEGQIELKIDMTSSKKMQTKAMFISRLSVDIIGVEEVEDGRRRIFLSLATELFDSQHPPPSTMVSSQTPEQGSEQFWRTRSATSTVPFCVNLPLKLGPPPYSSRQASIRYLLCPSAVIKVGSKRSIVRQVWRIQMLTVHNPERALASLPSPLLATDTLVLGYQPVVRSVKLTAGLHRQTWVSGGVLFTDVHIVNSTNKILKRIELQLEKSVLWFSHSAAGTAGKQANNLRLPAKIGTDVVFKTVIKRNKEWDGIAPEASEVRTCELEIPRGHVTIGDGRYFEVRYFIKVTVMIARNKVVSVKLPISLIHINSLDIMPNSVAQVAASIEAKRAKAVATIGKSVSRLPHTQGQAFSASHLQSFNKHNRPVRSTVTDDIRDLTLDLDNSPRRTEDVHHLPNQSSNIDSKITKNAMKMAEHKGPKLPRLQVSTSGLGFSESEFEILPDPPRKVMLSERERQMINQQRELKLQRHWNQNTTQSVLAETAKNGEVSFRGWSNVAIQYDPSEVRRFFSQKGQQPPPHQFNQRQKTGARPQRHSLPPSMPTRSRSRTNPEMTRASFSDNDPLAKTTNRPSRGKRNLEKKDTTPLSGYNLVENDVFGPAKPQ